MRAGLRVHLREVGVHVEHPRIGVAEETEPGAAQAPDGGRRVEPLAQHVPGAVAVEQRPGDGAIADPRAREGAGQLRDTAR